MPATVEQYIAALRSHVGWIEGPDNRTPYGASLGAPNQAWCMSFLAAGLEVGSRGAFVSDLQKVVGVTPDSNFGEATKTALIAWQKAHGLKGLGVWGPKSVAVRALKLA